MNSTLPLSLLIPKVDNLYKLVCVHCYSGSVFYQQVLLSVQVVLAFLLLIGYKAQLCAFLSWSLYFSLTLRNTWLAFILDRYFHYLLFYASMLPIGHTYVLWNPSKTPSASAVDHNVNVCNLATIAIKLQVFWIYLDAGGGKFMDPKNGWTLNPDFLPALDTYARHTVFSQYLYAILGPEGLRYMTPTVVWVELLCTPFALLGSFMQSRSLVNISIVSICALHIGIALSVRNCVLLSSVACAAWMVFLPPPSNVENKPKTKKSTNYLSRHQATAIICLIVGSLWFETLTNECEQSMEHIWSTLLHNRWNVFVGSEGK